MKSFWDAPSRYIATIKPASNLPLEQLHLGTIDIQIVSDSHSFNALRCDKILACLLDQRDAMISKSQYTHMLRACRFVVRRSQNFNAQQRLANPMNDNYLNRLRSVNAGTDLGYVYVHRATASTAWKDIRRKPIANITSLFLLEGYQHPTEAASSGFHTVSQELYPRKDDNSQLAYEQVYVLYADITSSIYHRDKILLHFFPTNCLCCNPELKQV